MERRYTSNSQGGGAAVRAATRLGRRYIEGYAANFYDGTPGTQYRLMPGVVERIMVGAFDRALRQRDDVRGLFNHNVDIVLGRVSSGTLTLSVDSKGLRPPATRADVVESIQRGDITGSSFGFVVHDESWTREGKHEVRQLRSLGLLDVSPVKQRQELQDAIEAASKPQGQHEAEFNTKVDRAFAGLFKLPEVFQKSDKAMQREFLQQTIDHIEVVASRDWSTKRGLFRLESGVIHLRGELLNNLSIPSGCCVPSND